MELPAVRTAAAIAAAVALAILSACTGPTADEPLHGWTPAPPPLAVAAPLDSVGVLGKCEDRAARFVARGLWRESVRQGTRDLLLRSTAHFSPKHAECDVLVEHRLTAPDGLEVEYAELWDVFRAEPLAAWTADPRPAARAGGCRLELAEDPAVSCRIAKYFIDDHLRH